MKTNDMQRESSIRYGTVRPNKRSNYIQLYGIVHIEQYTILPLANANMMTQLNGACAASSKWLSNHRSEQRLNEQQSHSFKIGYC